MSELFTLYKGNSSRMIAEYAAVERRGKAPRKNNRSRMSTEDYAKALYADGARRGRFGAVAKKTAARRVRFFEVPGFLEGTINREQYVRWLQRKATAHIRRDRKRGNINGTVSEYKRAIHAAVCKSGGRDAYTVEALDWKLISKYNNAESKKGRRRYKAKFALLPTVDHIGDGTGPADFAICAWRTNDAKGDLALPEFFALCSRVESVNRLLKKPLPKA